MQDNPPTTPDVEPVFSDPVQLEGRYKVDPIPGSKRYQGVCLVLDDGTRRPLGHSYWHNRISAKRS